MLKRYFHWGISLTQQTPVIVVYYHSFRFCHFVLLSKRVLDILIYHSVCHIWVTLHVPSVFSNFTLYIPAAQVTNENCFSKFSIL